MLGSELRDPDEARRFLAQGFWWQRVQPGSASTVRPTLEWLLEMASDGQPLPPAGFVADVGSTALGMDWENPARSPSAVAPGLPGALLRTYEDHVLGKLYADWTFSRAGDALRRYRGRDRARGLAFFFGRFRERSHFAGVEVSPGILKAALETDPSELLTRGWETLRRDGPLPLLAELYEGLVRAARRLGEVLGPEDVFELEHGTALDPWGQRLALRQVLRAAALLEANLPRQPTRPRGLVREAPTHLLEEDAYPVGGFSSLSTRGSIESLLHSQLAYMEKGERPDLFDVKFLRDELLYYARDENQFLRRRKTFVFALHPDLVAARFKDAGLPFQRVILLLALLVVLVRKLTEWLRADALVFQILLIDAGEKETLAAERSLLETLLREPVANGTVFLRPARPDEVAGLCSAWARKSLCRCLTVGVAPPGVEAQDTVVTRLRIEGPSPVLEGSGVEVTVPDEVEPLSDWSRTLERILQSWA